MSPQVSLQIRVSLTEIGQRFARAPRALTISNPRTMLMASQNGQKRQHMKPG